MKFFVTFARHHRHRILGMNIDHNTLVSMQAETLDRCKARVAALFGVDYACIYSESVKHPGCVKERILLDINQLIRKEDKILPTTNVIPFPIRRRR